MHIKEIKRLNKNLEKFNEKLDNNRIREYINITEDKKRLFWVNFISGVAKGLGYSVGFSFLSALVLYMMSNIIDVPIIGKYLADLIDIIEIYRVN